MKAALKAGIEKGTLIQVKSSYKLSPEAKKAPAKKVKAAAVKKVAPKKKTVCFNLKNEPLIIAIGLSSHTLFVLILTTTQTTVKSKVR